jgi:MEDS: MEthanogen/methylotroph, DcmR Sensory domain
MKAYSDWQQSGTQVFWGEIAPCEHLVQIYEDDAVFLDSLEGFVGGGIQAGDGVVVIATATHLNGLHDRLWARGFDLDAARSQGRYIPLDAEETLSRFMVRQWPDDDLFEQVVIDLIARAGKNGRRVRAFGEMVAVLWARGHNGATVRLEHLWHRVCQTEAFSLFCAYPRIGFTQNADASIREICAAHSKVVAAG